MRFAILEGGRQPPAAAPAHRPALPRPGRGRPRAPCARPPWPGPCAPAWTAWATWSCPTWSPGALLALGMTGAYGFTEAMAPFLSHPVPREVWEPCDGRPRASWKPSAPWTPPRAARPRVLPALLPALEALGARVEVREFAARAAATSWPPGASPGSSSPPTWTPCRPTSAPLGGRRPLRPGRLRRQGPDRRPAHGHREAPGRRAWPGWASPGRRPTASAPRTPCRWKRPLPACRALINGEPTELKVATGQRGVRNLLLDLPRRSPPTAAARTGPQRHPGPPGLAGGRPRAAPGPASRPGPRGVEPRHHPGRRGRQHRPRPRPGPAQPPHRARLGLPGGRGRPCARPGAAMEVEVDEPPCLYPRPARLRPGLRALRLRRPGLRALIPGRTAALAGPGSIRVAHTADEHLTLHDLKAGADLNARLARHFLQEPP